MEITTVEELKSLLTPEELSEYGDFDEEDWDILLLNFQSLSGEKNKIVL